MLLWHRSSRIEASTSSILGLRVSGGSSRRFHGVDWKIYIYIYTSNGIIFPMPMTLALVSKANRRALRIAQSAAVPLQSNRIRTVGLEDRSGWRIRIAFALYIDEVSFKIKDTLLCFFWPNRIESRPKYLGLVVVCR